MIAVDDDLVDAGDDRILLGRRDPVVGVVPFVLVVIDVVVADVAAGNAAQLRSGRRSAPRRRSSGWCCAPDLLVKPWRSALRVSSTVPSIGDRGQRQDDQDQRQHPAPAALLRRPQLGAEPRPESIAAQRFSEARFGRPPDGAWPCSKTSVAGSVVALMIAVSLASKPGAV